MHQSKQVHGIPNSSELIHLQYFSFELYLQFSSYQIQRKPTFIHSIKIQSLQDLQHTSAIEQISEYVVRSNFNQEFCNSLLEGILKASVQCVCHHISTNKCHGENFINSFFLSKSVIIQFNLATAPGLINQAKFS